MRSPVYFGTRTRQERIDVETAVETIINVFQEYLSLPIAKKPTTGLNKERQISSVFDVRGAEKMIFATRRLSQRKYTRYAWTLSIVERIKKAVCVCVFVCAYVCVYSFGVCMCETPPRETRSCVVCRTDQAGSKQVQSGRRDEGTMCLWVSQ